MEMPRRRQLGNVKSKPKEIANTLQAHEVSRNRCSDHSISSGMGRQLKLYAPDCLGSANEWLFESDVVL